MSGFRRVLVPEQTQLMRPESYQIWVEVLSQDRVDGSVAPQVVLMRPCKNKEEEMPQILKETLLFVLRDH